MLFLFVNALISIFGVFFSKARKKNRSEWFWSFFSVTIMGLCCVLGFKITDTIYQKEVGRLGFPLELCHLPSILFGALVVYFMYRYLDNLSMKIENDDILDDMSEL